MLLNIEHHYHIEDPITRSISICDSGTRCTRDDSYDIFGNKVDVDGFDMYKMVVGFREGELIPKTSKYLNTLFHEGRTIHYFEIIGSELLKETMYNDNST